MTTNYVIYYCVHHGDCFLKRNFDQPNNNYSKCCSDPGIKSRCYYDYLGYFILEEKDEKYNLFDTNKETLKRYFDDQNDGYLFEYFEKMILDPEKRNLAIMN